MKKLNPADKEKQMLFSQEIKHLQQGLFHVRPLHFALAGWFLLWSALQAVIVYYFTLNWQASVTDSLVNNSLLAISGLLMSNTLRFYQPGNKNFFYLLLWGLLLAIGNVFLFRWLMKLIFTTDTAYLQFLQSSHSIRFAFAWLMITFINVVTWGWYNIQSQQENEKRKTEAERLTREAELFRLRQQLQPHFLFNSLNSVSSLAGSNPEEARKMIQLLSNFLRGTLKKEETQQVTLAEELKHLSLYLEIEKVRFGHRLDTIIDCSDEAAEMKIPSLLLQPVMENAIKFGIYGTTGNIAIRLSAKVDKSFLQITVENPFDPSVANPAKGTGFGLVSVERRLYLLFARNDLLHTRQESNNFITTITIPQIA